MSQIDALRAELCKLISMKSALSERQSKDSHPRAKTAPVDNVSFPYMYTVLFYLDCCCQEGGGHLLSSHGGDNI